MPSHEVGAPFALVVRCHHWKPGLRSLRRNLFLKYFAPVLLQCLESPPFSLQYPCAFAIQISQRCPILLKQKACTDISARSISYLTSHNIDFFFNRTHYSNWTSRRITQDYDKVIRVGCALCDITGDICSLNSSAPSGNCLCSLAILRQSFTEAVDWY